jgi:quinol monooxygenase YgiN
MITLIATVSIKQGMMDQAIEAVKAAASQIKKSEPGCLAYIPHRVKGSDNSIIFYEKYMDKEALKQHSANLAASLKDLFPLLEPGMDIKTCYEITEG